MDCCMVVGQVEWAQEEELQGTSLRERAFEAIQI